MSEIEKSVEQALRRVNYPGYSRDIVSFGLVKGIQVGNGGVVVTLELTSDNKEIATQIKTESELAIKGLAGVERVLVDVKLMGQASGGARGKVGGIDHIVAVASGKGGVGWSCPILAPDKGVRLW